MARKPPHDMAGVRVSENHQRTMKEGKFTVLLVDAHTGIPFKEFFDKDGKAYVEAEPDREYLVRMRNDSGIRVRADMNVDGVSLNYFCDIGSNRTSCDKGLWNVRGGVSNYTALKFSLQPVRAGASNSEGRANSPHFGEVKVSFFEALGGKQIKIKDRDGTDGFRSASASGGISSSITPSGDKKKAFKTDVGMHETGGTMLGTTTLYETGNHLGDVTIHYCSVLGLIHKGILPTTPSTQGQAPTSGSGAPRKKRGTSAINASAIGGTRLGFEEGGEEEGGDFVEVVESFSEPVQKKAKTAEKDIVIDLCESDAE